MEPPKPLPTTTKQRTRPPAPAGKPLPAWAPFESAPEPPPRPRDDWDDWHDRYRAAAPMAKLDMLRALLAEDRPPAFYKDIEFASVVLDLPHGDLAPDANAAYIPFLEELFAGRPDVFNLGAEWFVRHMAYAYVKAGRERDIARLLPPLLDEAHRPDDPLFDVIDLVRLADLYTESRALVFATLAKADHVDFTPSAVDDLVDLTAYFLYREAIEAGCTPAALAELRRQLAEVRCDPSEERLAAMLAHRSGTAARRIGLADVRGQSESAGFNLYLLSLDFGRWLTIERQVSPLVADTLRHFVQVCLVEMRDESDPNPLILRQQRLDRYLAQLLGFMSVMHLRGVATLIAMRQFYQFLAATSLTEEAEHGRAKRICDELWLQMHRALGDSAPDYAFLNRYL
jgi:hypothetical protein